MPRGRRAGPPPSSSISGTGPAQVWGCEGEGVRFAIANFWDTPTPRGFLPVGTVMEVSDHTGDKMRTFAQRLQLHRPALPISLGANGSSALGGKQWGADFSLAAEVDF